MRRDEETRLRDAVQALRTDQLDAAQLADSARRVAGKLGINEAEIETSARIESCDDVRQLFHAYRTSTLPAARALLIEAHLRDCSDCRHAFRTGDRAKKLDWSAPKAVHTVLWRPRAFGRGFAAAMTLLVGVFFVYHSFWRIPPGVRAEVQSIDGSAYVLAPSGDHSLAPGDVLREGEHFRTSGGAHATLRLADGSMLEVKERSVLAVGARGRNTTVSLENGALIVQAAQRNWGHLYIKTSDCRIAVMGTIFSVDAGIKGSRVAVLQGAVHVLHAGIDTVVQAGNQMATRDNLGPAPVAQQIAWSHEQEKYLPLLVQLASLQHQIEQIPFPQPRYNSTFLERVPADTLFYASIPNLGPFLSQAKQIFHEQLQQSPTLAAWWGHGQKQDMAEQDALVDKLCRMSQYLGDEIVVVGFHQGNHASFAVVASVKRKGLDGFLKTQFSALNAPSGLVLLDERTLQKAALTTQSKAGGYALLRAHEIVVSNNLATLKQMNTRLNAGTSNFVASEFGQQVKAAYGRGAGVILAADLHRMIDQNAAGNNRAALEDSGIGGVRYLIAEHREANGKTENHLNLQFAGTRQRVASWLASPAPLGSLGFVTPNAAIAVAGLTKDPKSIADDLLAMAESRKETQEKSVHESNTQIDFRNDLAANLGGDFLLALDGPVLPTPSWKAVIEVRDSRRMEQTIERVTTLPHNQNNAHAIAIELSRIGEQSYYAVHNLSTGATTMYYTFADGYMILAPNRALLIEALQTHVSGNSLAHAEAFKALLPRDNNENYSAVVYQNLSPVLAPLLSHVSGTNAEALQKLAADSKPTAICAWGQDSRIEVASNSRLFGFDWLTLGSLLEMGNKNPRVSVKEEYGRH